MRGKVIVRKSGLVFSCMLQIREAGLEANMRCSHTHTDTHTQPPLAVLIADERFDERWIKCRVMRSVVSHCGYRHTTKQVDGIVELSCKQERERGCESKECACARPLVRVTHAQLSSSGF